MAKDYEIPLMTAVTVEIHYKDINLDDEVWSPDGTGWYEEENDNYLNSSKEMAKYIEMAISELHAIVEMYDEHYNMIDYFH